MIAEPGKEQNEEWRPIVGFEPYEASDLGRVRNGLTRRVLSQFKNESGYPVVSIMTNGKSRSYRVHAMVLTAFVGPRPDGQVTRHLNGVKTDNRLPNLTWGTQLENCQDKIVHGSQLRGELIGTARLTQEKVKHILCSTLSNRALAKQLGVGETAVRGIRNGDYWRHITRPNHLFKKPAARRLTPEQVEEVRLSKQGSRALASQLGVNRTTIQKIRSGQHWANLVPVLTLALLLAGCVAHTAADRCLVDAYLCDGGAPDATAAATADAPSAPAATSAPAADAPATGGECK